MCPRCGKPSFRTVHSARRAIGASRADPLVTHRMWFAGPSATDPDGTGVPVADPVASRQAPGAALWVRRDGITRLAPLWTYRCEDDPVGDWHITGRPLDPLVLPPPDSGQDPVVEVTYAVHAQRGRVFPTVAELVDRYGVEEAFAGRLRAVLHALGMLVPEPSLGELRVTVAKKTNVAVSRVRRALLEPGVAPHVPLPPPPAALPLPLPWPAMGRERLAQELLEAILAHPPGLLMPASGTVAAFYRVKTREARVVVDALHELGWLRTWGPYLLTARPVPPAPTAADPGGAEPGRTPADGGGGPDHR
jgi:hypothetical protein